MMKIAASILDCKDRINSVIELIRTNISYIHIDVMDGKFVPSIQFDNMGEIRGINLVTKYPMDVHLMMDNPISYIKELGNMNIEFITIHLEIDKDKKEIFKRIKELGYKVGLSIKPNTNVKDIEPYLDDIDMVLVMSVEPGLGGQSFMEGTVDRIKELKELIGNRNILIEVDGGINNETITKIKDVDIVVEGSYISKSDNYYRCVEELLSAKEIIENAVDDKVNKQNVNKIPFPKDGLIFSIISIILFFSFFCPYLFGVVIFPVIDAYNGAEIYGWHLAVVIAGMLVAIPTIVSFILGILSIKRYNKCNKKKNCFRKILNMINIISLIILGLFVAICILFFVVFFVLLFLI